MKIEIAFIRGKVARRVFTLFIISSLFPVILLTILSLSQINNFLIKQQYEHLRQTSKNYGMALVDRLLLLKMQLSWTARNFRQVDSSADLTGNDGFDLRKNQGFKRIILIDDNNQLMSPLGNFDGLETLIREEKNYLKAGHSILFSEYQPNFASRILLLQLLDPQNPERGLLVGEIHQSYLWGDIDSFGLEMQICVLNELNRAVFCSHQEYEPSLGELIKLNKSSSGQFVWRDHDHEEFLISYWSIFLKPNFLVPKWTIITNQLKANIALLYRLWNYQIYYLKLLKMCYNLAKNP